MITKLQARQMVNQLSYTDKFMDTVDKEVRKQASMGKTIATIQVSSVYVKDTFFRAVEGRLKEAGFEQVRFWTGDDYEDQYQLEIQW